MSNVLSVVALWGLALFAVLAPMMDEAIKAAPTLLADVAPATVPDALRPDPDTRFMGGLAPDYENVGDVIHSGRSYRDVRFHIDNAQSVEVLATAMDEPLEIELYDGSGALTGSATVPSGGEVQVTGSASSGEGNRIRIKRDQPRGEQARFRLRVRRAG